VWQVDDYLLPILKEMMVIPKKDVTLMIEFDKLHPEAITYEIIGRNNSRCALELTHKEHPELASDSNFHTLFTIVSIMMWHTCLTVVSSIMRHTMLLSNTTGQQTSLTNYNPRKGLTLVY